MRAIFYPLPMNCAHLRRLSAFAVGVVLASARHARSCDVFTAATATLLAGSVVAHSSLGAEVRIAGAAYLGDLPTHVAERRGLFADEGLQANVHYSESGKQNLARLRADETDFALMALTPLVLDRLADSDPGQAGDPVILASLLQSSELTAVLARPGAGMERPGDLAGRRIGFERGTNTEFVWWLFEQVHRIDRDSVDIVPLSFANTAAAVFSKRVDAVVLPEPWASRLQARHQRVEGRPIQRFHTRNLYAGRWVIVTTRRFVREHAEACRNVLAAYHRASEWIERSPNEAISIYADSIDTSRSLLTERWQALDYDINLDWALVSSLLEQFRWARASRFAEADEQPGVLELIDPGPLSELVPASVKIPGAATGELVR